MFLFVFFSVKEFCSVEDNENPAAFDSCLWLIRQNRRWVNRLKSERVKAVSNDLCSNVFLIREMRTVLHLFVIPLHRYFKTEIII